ncbi:hypothetical protein, partial [Hafnia psychrotolerans]|uniref:hypothetical protein n=1 Tax=Hafnia psychrotolerans TaxID=1477018 RepID=UPI001E583642
FEFEFEKASAAFKTTSNKRWKTARQFARVVTRNESTAQRRRLRLSSWSLKHGHGDPRSCRCFMKKRGVQRPARLRVSGRCGPTPTVLMLNLCLMLMLMLMLMLNLNLNLNLKKPRPHSKRRRISGGKPRVSLRGL